MFFIFKRECKLNSCMLIHLITMLLIKCGAIIRDLIQFISLEFFFHRKRTFHLWVLQRKHVFSLVHTTFKLPLSVQFSSVAQSCLTLCDPMNRSTPGLPVHHQLPQFTQTHVHRVSDAIQPSHPLSSPSPPALNPSQQQSLFQWVNSSHEVAKVLEFRL